MQFKVPQFLDIEDKIFGPYTFSQFVYLAGGVGLCVVIYRLLGLFWGAVPMAIVAGFSLALVYYRPNDKPFVNMLEAGFKYLFQDKLYIWKQKEIKKEMKTEIKKEAMSIRNNPKLTRSKLQDLAWSLDILDLKKENK